jgi:hypothetical protein
VGAGCERDGCEVDYWHVSEVCGGGKVSRVGGLQVLVCYDCA